MAHITASVYTSHVPAIGAAIDLRKTGEPYWQPVFKGYDFSKQWMTLIQSKNPTKPILKSLAMNIAQNTRILAINNYRAS